MVLVVLGRDRIRRTVFEYECEVLLRNISRFAVSNVSFQMTARSENITIIDPNISFGDVEVASGGTATGIDTCTFRVDRSEAINPAEIIWNSTAKIAKTGNKIEHTVSTPLPPETADFDGLNLIADKWLWQGTAGGIELDTVQDGTVNLADFAIFADQWGIK